MQLAIPAKRRMTPGSINRNAQQLRAEILEFWQHFVVERHLVAADRTPVRRTKSEHDGQPEKLAQFHGLIGRAMELKIRRRCPRRQRLGVVTCSARLN